MSKQQRIEPFEMIEPFEEIDERFGKFEQFVKSTPRAECYKLSTPHGLFCYVLRYPGGASEASLMARVADNCNCCVSRAQALVGDCGPDGPVFLANAPLESLREDQVKAVENLQTLAATTCAKKIEPTLVMITSSTYPAAEAGCRPCGAPYYHWTIVPSQVSTDEAARHYDALKHFYGQMDTRLIKLTAPEARESVEIMAEVMPLLKRPDHYTSCVQWVQKVQAFAKGAFEDLNEADRARVRVFAIMHGRANGGVHLDFYQAANIIDFLTFESRDERDPREALQEEMDRRSDPATYMVSQLNQRLQQEGVTSPYLFGLAWDGQFEDDLDIHVEAPTGEVCYYDVPSVGGMHLDFDANVSYGEAEPCENISVPGSGTYRVYVNNYTRRTFGKPIPFTIVCRQQGTPDVVHDGFWDMNRQCDNLLLVCNHTFTPVTTGDVSMSAKSAARATQLSDKWDRLVGTPTATIATLDDLKNVSEVSVTLCGQMTKTAAEVSHDFMQMAAVAPNLVPGARAKLIGIVSRPELNGLLVTVGARKNGRVCIAFDDGQPPITVMPEKLCLQKKKTMLSQRCMQTPKSVDDLAAFLEAKPDTKVCIHPRDYAPGYLVNIETETNVRKTTLPAQCHFRNKGAYAEKPVRGDIGNARLDDSWFLTPTDRVSVKALVKDSHFTFLVLEGARLSKDTAFPTSSGFYPTDLVPDLHDLRERWTYYHTQLKPGMPASDSQPMIGTFLVSNKAIVYINGVKTTLLS